MTDPLRINPLPEAGDLPERERDARVEELLLAGLDHYFGGQHELAISVWTRVLFLDRGHARAKAYIDRARSAIAEQQREGDELLQTGAAARVDPPTRPATAKAARPAFTRQPVPPLPLSAEPFPRLAVRVSSAPDCQFRW